MAREEKRFELIPEDEVKPPVIRLGSEHPLPLPDPIRLIPSNPQPPASRQPELPTHEDFKLRTHQPGVEALIEQVSQNPDLLEKAWGESSARQRGIAWGWFALVGLLLAGGAVWSLNGVKKSDSRAEKIRVATQSVLGSEMEEELEAARLIDRIDGVTRKFFAATSVAEMARLIRHPDRVRPMMEAYYQAQPVPANRVLRTRQLQPLTLDNRADFWMANFELADRSTRNLIVEILPDGEPRIDWETLVCYQPMAWDRYATERPEGTSLDFRVHVEPDNFHSHEFANSSQWKSFRLTALNSEATLFGYAQTDSEVAAAILSLVEKNQGRRTSVILRLIIPQGVQSRSGVVIEKLMSPRWLYREAPER